MFSFVLSRKKYETEIVMLLITKQQDEALAWVMRDRESQAERKPQERVVSTRADIEKGKIKSYGCAFLLA